MIYCGPIFIPTIKASPDFLLHIQIHTVQRSDATRVGAKRSLAPPVFYI